MPAILGLILLTSLALLATAPAVVAADAHVPAEELRSAKPGSILRLWPLEGGVPSDYKGFRILYRSTGHDNEPIAVTGALMFPEDAGSGPPRAVVAWAHPTSGVVTRCAPTLMPDLAGTVQGIDYFTDAGYVVVATDYPGLGGPGHHPYLVGASAARAVLDSVRAARQLKSAHAGDRFVVWGHSQGGHAALFTGIEAASYAPELKLLGVAAAAPATNLVDLFEADKNTSSGRSLTSMALYSWSRVFGFPESRFVVPRAEKAFARLAGDCILSLADFMREDEDEKALARDFLVSDPATDPTILEIMTQNTPGPTPRHIPVFIAQGTADELVRPNITRAYAREICRQGGTVTFHSLPGGTHLFAGRDGAYAAYEWMGLLFAGRTPKNDCAAATE
ncbi:alpha/beta fold hydrolase [Hyphomicrobium sp. CS1GBMeth3]|uniref:alpha/beta fold hydrolase n=1 Tax=Hyphomicrobium sp. CS1GBMeth3 TaxID=1892845 RepID=UPI000931A131|nr:alpha/beta fold hydrolase [Hyphomicrobium sp. CS1GBMeth3]